MRFITRLVCTDSRETLSGMSSESTTPSTNRKWLGSKSLLYSWISTLREYSFRPWSVRGLKNPRSFLPGT